jgi:hypothetical protein
LDHKDCQLAEAYRKWQDPRSLLVRHRNRRADCCKMCLLRMILKDCMRAVVLDGDRDLWRIDCQRDHHGVCQLGHLGVLDWRRGHRHRGVAAGGVSQINCYHHSHRLSHLHHQEDSLACCGRRNGP